MIEVNGVFRPIAVIHVTYPIVDIEAAPMVENKIVLLMNNF